MGAILGNINWYEAFPWLSAATRRANTDPNNVIPADTASRLNIAIAPDDKTFAFLAFEIAGAASEYLPEWQLTELFPHIPSPLTPSDFPSESKEKLSEKAINLWNQTYSLNLEALSGELAISNEFSLSAYLTELVRLNASSALADQQEPITTLPYHFQGESTDVISGMPGASGDDTDWAAQFEIDETAESSYLQRTIQAFLGELDKRELSVLRGRVLSKPKRSLDEIGLEFSVTRERIRQIESKLKAHLSEWLNTNPVTLRYSQEIRNFNGTLGSLDALLTEFPELDQDLFQLGLPLWFVFDQFDDSFESDGTWVAVPSLHDLEMQFKSSFDDYAGNSGFIPLEEFQAAYPDWDPNSFSTLVLWSKTLGYQLVGTALVSPELKSMNSLAFVLIKTQNQAMHVDEIHAAIAPDKSKRSLLNALSNDAKLNRVGIDLWALSEWGDDTYTSIQDEIIKRVDESGSVSLRGLLEDLPTRLGVAASSVRAYASNWPLKTIGDVVSRAKEPSLRARPIDKTKGVYFEDGGFTWRFAATFDHLRGSGSGFPTALAGALGNIYGQSLNIPVSNSNLTVTLRWNGNQATIATVRELLSELKVQEHDHVAFTFSKGEVTAQRLGHVPSAAEEKLRFLLVIPQDKSVDRRTIASRIGLPSESLWHEIIEVFETRKEEEILLAINEFNSQYVD